MMDANALLLMVNNYDNEQSLLQRIIKYWLDTATEEEEAASIIITISSPVPHLRVDNFYEEWIPRYLDSDFFALFRMNKTTFQKLLRALNVEEKVYSGGEEPLPREKSLLMTLWWLGKGEVLLSVADRFNVAISTVFNQTEFVLKKLVQLIFKYIVWPDESEAVDIENTFREKSGYPGVIGAIDVCNIRFKPPKEQQDSYIDKNSNHSIKLQGIATCSKIFTNIMVGFPGSAHDSRVFRNSAIYIDIEERRLGRKYFYNDQLHILGDKAYPLHYWILSPYKDNGHLTARQRRHNHAHSKTRIIIEHTFGLLKSRWRILRHINCNSVEKSINIIAACCLLHNFCYVHSDFWNEYDPIMHDDAEQEFGDLLQGEAINKRNAIADQLWQH